MAHRFIDPTVTRRAGLPTLRRVLALVAERSADNYSVQLAHACLVADAVAHRSLAHPMAEWAIVHLAGSLLASGWIDRQVADRLLAEFRTEWPTTP